MIDDGTVTRLDEDYYRVTAADPSLHWLQTVGRGMRVTIEDSSARLAAVALQGPRSREILRAACDADMDALKFFGVTRAQLDGARRLDHPHRLHRRPRLRGVGGEGRARCGCGTR